MVGFWGMSSSLRFAHQTSNNIKTIVTLLYHTCILTKAFLYCDNEFNCKTFKYAIGISFLKK